MSLPEHITQHREVATLSLTRPFWGKPRIASLLVAFMARIQDLEDDLHSILEERTLENADLVRLKVLGKIIGQPRLNFATEDYRTLLKARALANVSRGRAYDILAVLELVIGPGDYLLTEVGDATLHLSALVPVTTTMTNMLRQVIPDVRPAGVGLLFLTSGGVDPADVFLFGDTWDSSGAELFGTVSVF